MKKKILLLDTNYSAKPIYDYLQKTGNDVYVMGNKSSDSLAKSVDNYINMNYAKISEVEKFINDHGIDYLVPGGNDFSYNVCTVINEKMGFYNIDSIKTNELLVNKEQFREYSNRLNIHVPKIISQDKIKDIIPVIIKPADAYSGHGITVISKKNYDQLKNAINKAKEFSRTDTCLIEEYIQGKLFSYSAFIIDGKIEIDFIVEELCTVNPYVVNTSRVINDFNMEMLSEIRKDISKLIEDLNLCDGLIHTQFICNDNDFWIIEVTRRCPGDLYSKLIELSTGFPYAEFYARPFIDAKIAVPETKQEQSYVIRHTVTAGQPMTFNSIVFHDVFDKQMYIPLSLTGDKIQESPYSRVALLFGFSDTKENHEIMWDKLRQHELYELING